MDDLDSELALLPSSEVEALRMRLVPSAPLSQEGDVMVLGGGVIRRFRDGQWGEMELDWERAH